jgi:surface polysaccharide O-acyltransferase-like enzyme
MEKRQQFTIVLSSIKLFSGVEKMENKENSVKIKWIVSLRALACVAVVLLHVVACWQGVDPSGSIGRPRLILDQVIIWILVRWAVPCFLMISGYLLLDPNRDFTIRKIYDHIRVMAIALLTFGLAYCLIESILTMGISDIPKVLITSMGNLIEASGWDHMWYIYMMIGLYITVPLIRRFVASASWEEVKFLLITFWILTIVIPTVNLFFEIKITTLIINFSPFIFYFLAGYYLPRMEFRKTTVALCIMVGIIGFMLMMLSKLYGWQVSVNPDNLFVSVYSTALFYTASKSEVLEKMEGSKLIRSISSLSFFIYILHPFYLNLVMKGLHVYPDVMPIIIGEVVFWIFAFAASYISAFVLQKMGMLRLYGIK